MFKLLPFEQDLPETPWNAVWVPEGTPVGKYLNTPVPSLPLTEGLYIYCPYSDTLSRILWGKPEHNGICIIARVPMEVEYKLASLVDPDLAVAYDNKQRRTPSQN